MPTQPTDKPAPNTDPALWTTRPAFGVAGGPIEIVLTDEGSARAFSVGAQVRRGAPAEALEALAAAGGEGVFSVRVGAKHRLAPLGRYDQIAWGILRSLGYVESVAPDGVRLTPAGQWAIANGHREREGLLIRCRSAAAQVSP